MNILGKRNLYFLISALVIIPGLISLLLFGLRYSIEFTGGALIELKVEGGKIDAQKVKQAVEDQGLELSTIQLTDQGSVLLRLKPIDKDQNTTLQKAIAATTGKVVQEERFETIGPIIGRELTQKALAAVVVASIAIIFYIAWAFRQVPKPTSAWRFGICAIIALIHDVLVVVGIFSLLGHFYKVEIDTLFVTALLTIIGFSVHDTIVVFDRIRENLRRMAGMKFTYVVNESIIQTLARSISTSVTVVLTLFALFLFSSGSLRWFVVALLVGIISGTYSSIFNASPLLVVWQELTERKSKITRQ